MHGFFYGKLVLSVEPLPERLAFDVGHNIVQEALGLTRIVERQDVRMVESRSKLYLSQEPIRTKRRREIRMENLQRNEPLVLSILREIDSRHSSTTELAVDRVRVGECAPQPFERKLRCHLHV